MSASSFVTPSSHVCLPPLGKPDPALPKPEGLDTRNRIIRRAKPLDNTCWFDVFSMLKIRYKAPNTSHLSERRIEKLVSKARKDTAAYEASLPDIIDQINQGIVKKFFTDITRQTIGNPLLIHMIHKTDETSVVKVGSIIPDFLKQSSYQNLYDYMLYLKVAGKEKIAGQFFSELGIDLKSVAEYYFAIDPVLKKAYCDDMGWDEMSTLNKACLMGFLIQLISGEKLGLKISSWHPKQPIELLIKELMERGPLAVGGAFGKPMYSKPATKLNRKVEGRDVYGWQKSDPRPADIVVGHVILLVGAEVINSRGYVYFLDPFDDSDPEHPEEQKIYMMSYDRLTDPNSISDRFGLYRPTDLTPAPPEIGYALYGPKN